MNQNIERLQQRLLRAGVLIVGICILSAFVWPEQFFRSYLFGYLFWLGIALGSMAILLIYHLTGGAWGAVIRRILESAISTIPVLAILFLPIIVGLFHGLYVWTNEHEVAKSEVLRHKTAYLNPTFFILRAAIYFLLWGLLMRSLIRWSRRQDEAPDPVAIQRLTVIGGVGLLLYGLTMTFASVDWMMSLEPHWFSTIYGLLVITGQVLSAFAFAIAVSAWLARTKPFSEIIAPLQFHDLGKLMLAFVMIWAYLAFSQFLIIWSGNLPEETPWYIHRLQGGWQTVAIALILFHFAFPFLLLLSRPLKQQARTLASVAVLVLIMRLVDLYWLLAPDFHQEGFAIHFLDVLLPLGLGAIWLSAFFNQLSSRPIVVIHDPNLPARDRNWKEVIEHG